MKFLSIFDGALVEPVSLGKADVPKYNSKWSLTSRERDEVIDSLKKSLKLGVKSLIDGFNLSEEERTEVLNDDFLLLMSIIADQSVNSSIAWHVTFNLKRRLNCDSLSPNYLLNHEELVRDAMKKKPALHRYPDKMTDYFMSLSKLLLEKYNGNASQLLDSNEFTELVNRLIEVKGISRKKAGLTCLILEIDESRKINNLNKSYALMDTHVQSFFKKYSELNHTVSEKEATEVFKEIYPQNPALVSTIIWNLDREKKDD